MALVTMTEPSADEQQVRIYNTMMSRSNRLTLTAGKKYAAARLRLAPAVNQPDDYPALKTAIEAVAGIQTAQLLIDGQCPSTVPADRELRMICEVNWFDDFFNTRKRQVGIEVVAVSQKIAVVMFELATAVTRADYPALKTAVEAVAEIQACAFFADHDFANATAARAEANGHLRIEPVPEE